MILSEGSPLSGISPVEGLLGKKTVKSGNRQWGARTDQDSGHQGEKAPNACSSGTERRGAYKKLRGKPPANRPMAGTQQDLLELATPPSSFPFQNSPEGPPGTCRSVY